MIFVADLGGSTASIAIFSSSGNCLSSSSFPPFIYSQKTHTEFIRNISTIIKSQEKQLSTLVIGSAGLGDRASQRRVYEDLQKVFLHQIHVCTDAELALWNAYGQNEGLILILGTGSIFWGRRSDKQIVRSNGYGPLFDTLSGGFSLAKSYITELLDAEDSKTYADERQIFCKSHSARNIVEFSRGISFDLQAISKLASLAKWICDYAKQNHASLAYEVVEAFSILAAKKTSGLLHQHSFKKRNICLLGGLCKNPFLQERLEKNFHNAEINVAFIDRDNSYGGYALAKYYKDRH